MWKADSARDIHCPAKGIDSRFVRPANLDDLRVVLEPAQSIWLLLLKSILFLVVVCVIYTMVMNNVDNMRDQNEIYMKGDPTWITVVVPCTTDKSVSDSDSSGEAVSMKAWSYQNVAYQSIDSDLSDESNEDEYRGIPRI